jgi:hypothetical protein
MSNFGYGLFVATVATTIATVVGRTQQRMPDIPHHEARNEV